jgi:hypothetical protein
MEYRRPETTQVSRVDDEGGFESNLMEESPEDGSNGCFLILQDCRPLGQRLQSEVVRPKPTLTN